MVTPPVTLSVEEALHAGVGEFQPPPRDEAEKKALRAGIRHRFWTMLKFYRKARSGAISAMDLFEECTAEPNINACHVSKGEFLHIVWRMVKRRSEDCDVTEEPNSTNNGNFKVQAIPGWDARSKVTRRELWWNFAAKKCLQWLLKNNKEEVNLSVLLSAVDKAGVMECTGAEDARADWITNLKYFPTMFVISDEADVVDTMQKDWLIKCPRMDEVKSKAAACADEKEWMVNALFGLDASGQPMDAVMSVIEDATWPAPGTRRTAAMASQDTAPSDTGAPAAGAAAPEVAGAERGKGWGKPTQPQSGAWGTPDSSWSNWGTGGNSTGGNSGGWKKGSGN